MTKTEAVQGLFKKAVLPVAIAGLLYCIFKSACMRMGSWIFSGSGYSAAALRHPSDVCLDRAGRGLPGRRRRTVRAELRDRRLIGGFVLVWRLLVAAWYVPLTIYRLIVG